jgi:hypothetical protein
VAGGRWHVAGGGGTWQVAVAGGRWQVVCGRWRVAGLAHARVDQRDVSTIPPLPPSPMAGDDLAAERVEAEEGRRHAEAAAVQAAYHHPDLEVPPAFWT